MTSSTYGGGGSSKRWHYSISLFSKMWKKGEGGVKNLKKWVTSFMGGPSSKRDGDNQSCLFIPLLWVANSDPDHCQATDWTSSSWSEKVYNSLAWIKSQMTRLSNEVVAKMQSAVGWKFTVSTLRGCDGRTSSGWFKPVEVNPVSGILHNLI